MANTIQREPVRRQLGLSSQTWWLWIAPCAVILIGSAVFRWTDLDLRISGCFYNAETGNWPWFHHQPWLFLFYYGVYLPLAVGIAGAVVALLGLVRCVDQRSARMGLFLALTISLGPGLIINGILKPSWGRPRPTNCIEFGGESHFERLGIYWGPNLDRSFPSGHASMGFFLLIPALLFVHQRRRLGLLILTLGMSYGLAMGLGRIVQGRHFASDILWSLAITYFCGLTLLYLLKLHQPVRQTTSLNLEAANTTLDEKEFPRVPFRSAEPPQAPVVRTAFQQDLRRAA